MYMLSTEMKRHIIVLFRQNIYTSSNIVFGAFPIQEYVTCTQLTI